MFLLFHFFGYKNIIYIEYIYIIMTSVVSEKSNNNTENNVANNLASKLTYEKCPQDIMQILLKSRVDDSNVGKNASENI